IEQIAEIDICHIAQRNNMGKADLAIYGPVDHSRRQRARLGKKSEVASKRRAMREARIETDTRYHQPNAIWALNAQQMRLRSIQHRLLQLTTDASGYHHCCFRAFPPQLF